MGKGKESKREGRNREEAEAGDRLAAEHRVGVCVGTSTMNIHLI